MSEHSEQYAFVDYVLWTYQHRADFLRPLFFSIPNGAWLGGKSYAMMNKLKAEGLTPGVADVLYLQPRGSHAYLAIEMKDHKRAKESTGGLTENQIAFLKAAKEAGALACVCYGANDAIETFDRYMALPVLFLEG